MTFIVKRLAAHPVNHGDLLPIERQILQHGYVPLMAMARQRFLSAVDESIELDNVLVDLQPADIQFPERYSREYYELAVMSRRYADRSNLPYPLAGDIFFSPGGRGLLYATVSKIEHPGRSSKSKQGGMNRIEIGFLGDDSEAASLEEFSRHVSEALDSDDESVVWQQVQFTNAQFKQLASNDQAKFGPGAEVSEEDTQFASMLEDQVHRDVAITVRRGGGMLIGDPNQRLRDIETERFATVVATLEAGGLLARDYVIICRKTSNQVNRVASKNVLQEMSKLGILCSCGKPIGEERVEELLSPTNALNRMLNQSFWMSALVVGELKKLGVPPELVLLNLKERAEEIDAFADVDGTLLMFELKDNEFSMGHAYPFAGRIGLYKPDYAIIVSTKGVAPEVIDYFGRAKPDAEIIYINSIEELAPKLDGVVTAIRSSAGLQLIDLIETVALGRLSLTGILGRQIGIQARQTRQYTDVPF